MEENEVSTTSEVTSEVSTPTPEPTESAPVTQESAPEPQEAAPTPQPELTLREKIQKKADEVAAKRQKDPKTGQFASKDGKTPEGQSPLVSPQKAANDGSKPVVTAGTPAFTPNYKLKVMEQDREIPEVLRPLIKDAESEKQVREIMEKAYGLDYVKPKLDQARTQLQTVSQENGTIKGQISNLVGLYNRGDLDGWFKALGVPEERVLQWMADKISYQQLPAEQKAILDSRKQAEDRAFAAERQASTYQRQHEQNLTQQVQTQLESVLARPDVKSVADTFDARMNKPGAFRAEIARRGDYVWQTRKELIQPDQLVAEMMSFLGPVQQSAPPATPAVQAQPAPSPASASHAQPAKTPVIPNISGRSASALPAKVRSIDDIRAKLKEMQSVGS